ncbi:DUF192 domain-containing protein [Candidatus Woesearchaeota archaeon]|nr:DUF192 domain-containing protein [Candidatus Woesearchaeota archaeon]
MIRNLTRKSVVCCEEVWCTTFVQHVLGLMFKARITPHVLAFASERYVTIHTFFVAGALDLIFLKNRRVVEITQKLLPFSWYTPRVRTDCVIELRAGTVAHTRTRVGDKIEISTQ